MVDSFGISFDKQSLLDIRRLFKELPDEIGIKAMRSAVRRSAKRVQSEAKSILLSDGRVDTQRLIENVKVKVKRQGKYGNNFFKATIGVEQGRKRNDPRGAYYAGFIEFGHAIVGKDFSIHGFQPATPFLRDGLARTTNENVRDFSTSVKMQLEKATKRLAKRRKTKR